LEEGGEECRFHKSWGGKEGSAKESDKKIQNLAGGSANKMERHVGNKKGERINVLGIRERGGLKGFSAQETQKGLKPLKPLKEEKLTQRQKCKGEY